MNTCGTTSLKLRYVLPLLTLCVALAGCSSSPSVGDGERAIQDRIKAESEGRIKLTKFQKTNGQLAEPMGVKMYGMDFAAEIEFTEDCKWVTGFFGMGMSFRTAKPVTPGANGLVQFMDASQNPGNLLKMGQRAQVSGVVRFVKKEKGWAVEGVDLQRATVGDNTNSPSASFAEGRDTAQMNACINNLRQIDQAKQQWAVENHKAASATPVPTDLDKYLPGGFDALKCLKGGNYTINAAAAAPTCSIPGHRLPN